MPGTDYIGDSLTLRRDDLPNPTQWPKLTCGQANQLALTNASDLRLEADREILFQGAGQIRTQGDLRILTGAAPGTENLRILANGNVGIGTASPGCKLDVSGNLRVTGDITLTGTLTGGLAPNIVDTSQIKDNAVTAAKMADGNVGPAKLANASVTGDKIADAAVTPAKILDGSIGTAKLANVAVTRDKIADAAVTAAKILDGSVTAVKLATGAIPACPWTNVSGGINYAGGNVGIGTAGPGRKIDVTFSSAGGDDGIDVENTAQGYATTRYIAGTSSMYVGQAANTANWKNTGVGSGIIQTTGNLVLATPLNTPRILVNSSSGNVGIGTTGPGDKLDVAGNLRILTGSNPVRFTSGWTGFPDAVTNQAEISNDTGTYKTLMIVGNKSAGLGRRVSVWDRLEVNGAFSVSGNVGIGTTSIYNPQGWNKVLDILGTSHARLNVRSTGGVVTSVFSHDDWNGARGVIGTESNHPLTFATNYGHRMTIDTAGNVGIGTAEPKGKLDVAGGWIVMRAGAWNDGAKTRLDTLPNNTLIIGGDWSDDQGHAGIYFYWKDRFGKKYGLRLESGFSLG